MEPELVTLAEAARRLRLSAQRLGQLAARSGFPERQRIGNAWVVDWPKVERWFQERKPDKGGRPRKPKNPGRFR